MIDENEPTTAEVSSAEFDNLPQPNKLYYDGNDYTKKFLKITEEENNK